MTTFNQSISYGSNGEPPLTLGRTYALQIQAHLADGRQFFQNNGLSEIVVFQYGKECQAVQEVEAEAIDHKRIKISWDVQPEQSSFTISYRVKGRSEWYEKQTTPGSLESLEIRDLNPDTEYEYQVSSSCNDLSSEYSESGTVRTMFAPENTFECGNADVLAEVNHKNLLNDLIKGDVITSGDFKNLDYQCRKW